MWKHFQGRSPWRLWSLYKRTWQLLNWHWEWLNKSDVFWWENQIYLNTECWRHPAFLGKGRYLTFLKAGWRDMASSKQGRRRNLASLKKKRKGALICLCGGWRKFWHFMAMVEKGFSTVVNSVKLSWGGLQEGSAVQLHLLNMGFVVHEQSGAVFNCVQ